MLFQLRSILIVSIFCMSSPALAVNKFQFVRDEAIKIERQLLEYVDQESKILIEKINRLYAYPKVLFSSSVLKMGRFTIPKYVKY
jgi:hypothetical protein